MRTIPYTCTDITCDAYAQAWDVEVHPGGEPVEEAEARCPDCYGQGVPRELLAVA